MIVNKFCYIRCMLLRTLLLLFLLCSTSVQAQTLVDELKKKYFGIYFGEIPGYEYNTGSNLVDVTPTSILVELDADRVVIEIGKSKKSGIYTVLFKGDDYYVLDAVFEGEPSGERLVIHENKTLTREGTFPQPNAQLGKLSKREARSVQRVGDREE